MLAMQQTHCDTIHVGECDQRVKENILTCTYTCEYILHIIYIHIDIGTYTNVK